MRNSVAQIQHLLGACLRDPQRRRTGRIVGIDQTRDQPALLIIWEGQTLTERVTLPVNELQSLVTACMAIPPMVAVCAKNEEKKGTDAVSLPVMARTIQVGGR